MGDAARIHLQQPAGALRSRRLLRLAGDDRLVDQVRRGSEAAFEVLYERHSAAILAFCRHMLGSREEAEDALQHTFTAAYRDLARGGDREIALRPWLFTIARNRCLSLLRARREHPVEEVELGSAGVVEEAERRDEMRRLLADLRDLPEDQRAALLLAEAGGLAQADIGAVLGCEAARVKALVYRARSALIARRDARELPCEEVREQIASLRGGSLRRSPLQLHLRECDGCRDFREQVRHQRRMLAVALPVTPSLGLKSAVLGAVGSGGGSVAAGGGAATGGAAFAGVAKVAALAVLAAGGVAGSAAVVQRVERDAGPAARQGEPTSTRPAGGDLPAGEARPGPAVRRGAAQSGYSPRGRGRGREHARARGRLHALGRGVSGAPATGRPAVPGTPGRGHTGKTTGPPADRGRPAAPGSRARSQGPPADRPRAERAPRAPKLRQKAPAVRPEPRKGPPVTLPEAAKPPERD